MTYPNGKAIHDAMISKSRYSLKNKFRIVPILAPLTLRIAISLRRCSHDKVTKEKMPNTAIAIHIKETIAYLKNFPISCTHRISPPY